MKNKGLRVGFMAFFAWRFIERLIIFSILTVILSIGLLTPVNAEGPYSLTFTFVPWDCTFFQEALMRKVQRLPVWER